MSVQHNKHVLETAMRHFGDPATRERYFELYHDQAVLHGYPGVEPGIESIRRFYEAFWAAFPDARISWEPPFGEEDRVAVVFEITGTHRGEFLGVPATGTVVRIPGVTALRFRDGRCIERWSAADFLGVLQQLGALAAPA